MIITRRSFARTLAIAVPVAVVAAAMEKPYKPWCGTLTVTGWHAHHRRTGKKLQVFVDGVNVSGDCYRANDRKGYALVYRRNAEGHHYVGPDGRAAWARLRGDVRIVEV